MSAVENPAQKTFQVMSDNYTTYKMTESPEHLQVRELVQNMNFNNDLKISLLQTVVEVNYWDEKVPDGAQGICGSYGACGCEPKYLSHCHAEDKRLLVDPKQLSTRLTVTMSNDSYQKLAEELKAKTALIKLTPGPRQNTYDVEKVLFDVKTETIKCGVYKRANFDEAFAAYQKLHFLIDGHHNESITELSFASMTKLDDYESDFNLKVVDIKPVSDMPGCKPLATSNDYKDVLSGVCNVTITIHNVDLMNNMETLKDILSLFA